MNADVESWVGRTEETEDLIAPFQAVGLAATLDRAAPPAVGDALPPAWHWAYFAERARQSELGPDGHEARGEFLPPIELPRRMWAGDRLLFHGPLVIGQPATRRSEILSVSRKEGRRSGPLAFVTVHHRFFGPHGLAVEEWHDIVYRAPAAPDAPAPEPQPAPMAAVWRRRVVPDEVMLFRYSAVTFNGPRIHYDRPYVTGIEGYEGLIVHGPLTATLLLDLAAREAPEARVAEVRFRAVSPLFANRAVTLEGAPTDGGCTVWALNDKGALAMRADVTFAA